MTEVPDAFRRPAPLASRPLGSIDPLRFCVATTVAAIAWLITPALAVIVFASIGISMYARARRAGLLKSRCLLGDTRWVIAYLAVLWLAATGYLLWRLSA